MASSSYTLIVNEESEPVPKAGIKVGLSTPEMGRQLAEHRRVLDDVAFALWTFPAGLTFVDHAWPGWRASIQQRDELLRYSMVAGVLFEVAQVRGDPPDRHLAVPANDDRASGNVDSSVYEEPCLLQHDSSLKLVRLPGLEPGAYPMTLRRT